MCDLKPFFFHISDSLMKQQLVGCVCALATESNDLMALQWCGSGGDDVGRLQGGREVTSC